MFIFAAERKEIARVKERIADERERLSAEARALAPSARRAAAIGSATWAARKFLPVLRPIVIGMAQRSLLKRGKRGWMKVIGLIAGGFAAWRIFGGGGDEE